MGRRGIAPLPVWCHLRPTGGRRTPPAVSRRALLGLGGQGRSHAPPQQVDPPAPPRWRSVLHVLGVAGRAQHPRMGHSWVTRAEGARGRLGECARGLLATDEAPRGAVRGGRHIHWLVGTTRRPGSPRRPQSHRPSVSCAPRMCASPRGHSLLRGLRTGTERAAGRVPSPHSAAVGMVGHRSLRLFRGSS